MLKKIYFWRHVSVIFSCLTIMLGVSVLIGWHSKTTFLLQYQDDTIAMVYNTALSFFVFGVCILLLLFNYYKVNRILSGLIIILSLLVLLQAIFDINLHVDEIFIKHHFNVANFFPGRMAPNTSLLFIMSGIIILIIGQNHWSYNMGVVAAVFSICMLFMSLLFASGYISSIQNAYEWSQYTPMAFNTSLGFILLSMSLLSALLYRCRYHGMSVWPAMPVIVGLGMFFINSLLALSVYKQQYANKIDSLLPLVILILGTIFTLLFSLLFYYVQLERKRFRIEYKLRALMEATLDATGDGIIAWNYKGIISHCNQKFSKQWRLPIEKIEGQNILDLLKEMSKEAENKKNFIENMNALIRPSQNYNSMIIKLQASRFFEVHVQTQKTQDFIFVQVLSFHDISTAKNLEKDMMHRNTHDLLTGLANKAMMMHMLEMAIQGVLHNKNQLSIFVININKFTHFNDVFGRSKCDELIKMIAERLKAGVSKSDTLFRLGGDEFVIISLSNKFSDSQKIINNIFSALKPNFAFYGSKLKITCSIGISSCPKDGIQVEELLRCAGIALINAKAKGRNSFVYYTNELSEYTYDSLLIENELSHALEKNELELYFQPLIELKTKKIFGFEALLRWHHPRLGLLTPDKFLHIANDLGLMNDIGTLVINKACQQLNQWQKKGFPLVKIAINVTAHQFRNNQLLEDINKALMLYEIPKLCLEVELTEQILLEGSKEVFYILNKLREKKISIALDDFGTGYSSLSYIKKFPIDKLKIDQSFIRDMLQTEDDKNLLKAIINLSEAMNLKVLAEGIENQEQLDFLLANNCVYGQGFFFAKPMSSLVCASFLKEHKNNIVLLEFD